MNGTHAIEIFNSIADGKDGTLNTQGGALPDHGYFVGGVTQPLVFESKEDANWSASLRAIGDFVEIAGARYIGWWTDSGTGKVYIDVTTWHADLEAAAWAAVNRHEIAFWDIANQSEIRV